MTSTINGFVVVVELEVRRSNAEAFERHLKANAARTLADEPGCHQFDICRAGDGGTVFLLYEVYADRADFETHLATMHFREFDAATADLIVSKTVRSFVRLPADQ